jgi:aldose 1-epimerase
MRLHTDAPGCQLYVGGFLDGERGKGGAVYPQHGGFCLETQLFPDGVNQAQAGFPSPVLRPGEQYVHTMVTQLTAA